MVDCGLYQGVKTLRMRNREPLPFDPRALIGVVLTHAHIDHSGFLPVLVREGFGGFVYSTPPTRNICNILLPDSGRLQEEDARYAERKGFSKHKRPRPLYTEKDARKSLRRFRPVPLGEPLELGELTIRFAGQGHILGAANVHISEGDESVLFSGDVGRPTDPLMMDPSDPTSANWIVIESTYGDRLHADCHPAEELAEVVNRTTARGGTVVIPAFAVGRSQNLLYTLAELIKAKKVPDVPVYLNSPMARNVTRLYKQFPEYHRLSPEECGAMFGKVKIINTATESKALNRKKGPMVIVSASGMATGGRVLHHLRAFGPDPKNTILFAGYQATGTRGSQILGGAKKVKIHGRYCEINAEVDKLDGLSAHADREELIDWLNRAPRRPEKVIVVHGEPGPADTMRAAIQDELGIDAHVAQYKEVLEL